MGFSEKQEALVKESWEMVKQDIPGNSLRYLTLILEMVPEAKGMFSFMQDTDEIQDNPQLKAHAVKLFTMTCEAAVQLREKGQVVVTNTTLKHLGSVHNQKGVMEPQFQMFKEAFLRTMKEAVGGKWSEEMKGAWVEAYDQLVGAIKAEMKKESANAS